MSRVVSDVGSMLVDDARASLRSRGFQSGWLKNRDGNQGKRWYLVTCGSDCAISPGCKNCPANKSARDNKLKVKCLTDRLTDPLRWVGKKSVFVCPEGDPFHHAVPERFIAQVFAVMESCQNHRFVLLTKREDRMLKILSSIHFPMLVYEAGRELLGDSYVNMGNQWGRNVLIGVSVENQECMKRANILPELPRAMSKVIFVAPQLEYVQIPEHIMGEVSWVISNGERGRKWCVPRECRLEWQLELAHQCENARVPFFLLRRHHQAWVDRAGGNKYMQFPEVLFD